MIAAIIVTYNQIEDLKKCISSVQNQTSSVNEIVVVNNGSSDGTAEWLNSQPQLTVITQENRGSSGGQNTGINYAYKKKFDWIWCLDQDVFPSPDALEQLINSKAIKESEIGFLSSFVSDPKGTPAYINLPYIRENKDVLDAIKETDELQVMSSSFGSVLFSRKAIEAAGLPIREFFIWGDDVEYTMRIIEKGFKGYLIKNSKAVHNIDLNVKDPFPYMDPEQFKTQYAIRNTLYIIKLRNKVFFNSRFRGFAGCFLFLSRLLINRYKRGFPGFKYHFKILKYFFSGLIFSPRRKIQTAADE